VLVPVRAFLIFSEKLAAPLWKTPVNLATNTTMNLPPPQTQPSLERESPPAIIRKITREDVLWNRPVFRAPPLVVRLPAASTIAEINSVTSSRASS
jgi:hypothetical protein